MKSSLKRAAFALLTLLVCLQPALAQQRGANASERSYAQARRVLEAGIEALGGLDAVRASQEVTLKVTGTGFARNQSADITTAYDRAPHTEWLYVDLANRRYLFEQRDELPGGTDLDGRQPSSGEARAEGIRPRLATSREDVRSEARLQLKRDRRDQLARAPRRRGVAPCADPYVDCVHARVRRDRRVGRTQ